MNSSCLHRLEAGPNRLVNTPYHHPRINSTWFVQEMSTVFDEQFDEADEDLDEEELVKAPAGLRNGRCLHTWLDRQ